MSDIGKINLWGETSSSLQERLAEQGLPKFAESQMSDWLYRKHELDISKWSNLSKKSRAWALDSFETSLPRIVWKGESKDGTVKFLMAMKDQKTVEAVVIPAPGRMTLCLSSQVGCAIGCTFCHTGTMGLTRHLKSHEIVGQYMAAQLWLEENRPGKKLSNIVFMGQGEPLHNFNEVKKACEIFLYPKGLGLGQRRVTLSTSGLVPKIEQMEDFPPVNIAISLHAAHDNVRSELMPINKRFDLTRLFKAIETIPLKAHRYITYEYILIRDLNDGPEDIKGLLKLLKGKQAKVNLIPFNEYPESRFKRPSSETISWFQNSLNAKGVICTTRVTKGDDILAACGQLKSLEGKINLWAQEASQGD